MSRLRAIVSGLFRRPLVQNIGALYGVQVANYLLPLVTIPYLARVLGPSGWGLVLFSQSVGMYLVLVVEYGFGLSATREVARYRNQPDRLANLLAEVLGAKGLLVLLTLPPVVLLRLFVPEFSEDPIYLWMAVAWGILQAAHPLWYFQGQERLKLISILTIGAKLVTTAGVFIVVRQPGDGWLVLALQALGALVPLGIGSLMVYREVPWRRPTWAGAVDAIKLGWTMFLLKSGTSIYTTANVMLLGLLAPPAQVGLFGGAERIAKFFVRVVGPIKDSLYPRLSHLAATDRAQQHRLAQMGLAVMGGLGLLMTIGVAVAAPILVRVVLGSEYEDAIPVVRILAALPFLIAMSHALGTQWLLPLGYERPFMLVTYGAGPVNLVLALALATQWQATGMAVASLAAQIFSTGGLYLALRRRGVRVFGRGSRVSIGPDWQA